MMLGHGDIASLAGWASIKTTQWLRFLNLSGKVSWFVAV